MKGTVGNLRGFIRSNHEVAQDHYVMAIELPGTFGVPLPGQFLMIRKHGANEPLLSRPFSIYSIQKGEETTLVEILYRVVGRGTELFASFEGGEMLDVLGPLGRGFFVDMGMRKITLVAGGVGVAPLSFLAEYCRRHSENKSLEIKAYLGARTERLLAGIERLNSVCDCVKVATDDGSRGFHGAVTELFRHDFVFDSGNEIGVYACGPRAMMKGVSEIAAAQGMKCQVSMEEKMACGFGVCRGCAVKVLSNNLGPTYRPACTEGPVFDSGDIDWNGC